MARKPYSKFRSRLWKLVEIDRQLREQLQRGRPCTTKSLLEALGDGTDERTLRRLIELMRIDLGAPIEYDRSQHTYKYTHPNWIVPNVHLDEAQMQALATAVQAGNRYRDAVSTMCRPPQYSHGLIVLWGGWYVSGPVRLQCVPPMIHPRTTVHARC